MMNRSVSTKRTCGKSTPVTMTSKSTSTKQKRRGGILARGQGFWLALVGSISNNRMQRIVSLGAR